MLCASPCSSVARSCSFWCIVGLCAGFVFVLQFQIDWSMLRHLEILTEIQNFEQAPTHTVEQLRLKARAHINFTVGCSRALPCHQAFPYEAGTLWNWSANSTVASSITEEQSLKTAIIPQHGQSILTPNITCIRAQTRTKGWESTVLRLSGVHVHHESPRSIVFTVPNDHVEAVRRSIHNCSIDGHFYAHRRPKLIVRGDDTFSCTPRSSSQATILSDSEFWGSYYHSVMDHLLPWFITAQVLNMRDAYIQFYSSDVIRGRSSTTMKNLKSIAECLGLRISSLALAADLQQVGIQVGCYGHVSVGFFLQYRPVHYPRIKASDCVYVPEIQPWIQMANRRLRECLANRTHLTTNKNDWLFVLRTAPGDDRTFHLTGSLPQSVTLSEDTDPISWNAVHRLVAVSGATFANQLLMPFGSTLVEIHVPVRLQPSSEPTCWHSGVARYLGNTFVSIDLKTNHVNLTKLGLVLEAAEDVGAQYCVTKDMQLPLQCRQWYLGSF